LASCHPPVSSGVHGSKSNKGYALLKYFYFQRIWLLMLDSLHKISLQVVIGSEDLAANHDVMQIVEVLDDRSRDSRLLVLLDKYHEAQR
jgi:hypothetical protein